MIRRLVCFLLCMGMLCGSACAEVVSIPWDQEVMAEVNEAYYVSEREYEDPSLHVVIDEGIFHDTSYLVARVKIADPSQLRAYVTENRNMNKYPSKYATEMAKYVNAVFAISGDVTNMDKSRSGTKTGKHITRNFETWLTNARPDKNGEGILDILIIDTDGNLTIIPKCTEDDIAAFNGTIVSTYSFGPGLVIDSQQVTDYSKYGMNYGARKQAQRICIGQTGPLEYIAVYSAGPDQKTPEGKKCKGLTISEFAELVYAQGDVINAYNLDGGTSTWMVFHDERLNSFGSKNRNTIADIIYFASAWVEE